MQGNNDQMFSERKSTYKEGLKTIEEIEKELVNHVRFNKRVVKKHLMDHDLLGVALSKCDTFYATEPLTTNAY